jgi:hypothetical protein
MAAQIPVPRQPTSLIDLCRGQETTEQVWERNEQARRAIRFTDRIWELTLRIDQRKPTLYEEKKLIGVQARSDDPKWVDDLRRFMYIAAGTR